MATPTITIIIPVFNEFRTVGSVVEIACSWDKSAEVIVVDDGSTDDTGNVLAGLAHDTLRLISYTPNRGKGYAVAQGITKATGEILLFLDADATGLTHRALDALVTPLVENSADMTMGLVRLWRFPGRGPHTGESGFRAFWRRDIIPHVDGMKTVGYGIEHYINNMYRDRRVLSIHMPYVFIVDKLMKKTSLTTLFTYIREAVEIRIQLLKNYMARRKKKG